jgi:hypothetical protein
MMDLIKTMSLIHWRWPAVVALMASARRSARTALGRLTVRQNGGDQHQSNRSETKDEQLCAIAYHASISQMSANFAPSFHLRQLKHLPL